MGLKSQQDGKTAETLFENWCDREWIIYKKIKDAGVLTKRKKFFRLSQLCDYIIFQQSNSDFKFMVYTDGCDSINFVDVKKFTGKRMPMSFFYTSGKQNNTHKQVENFIEISGLSSARVGVFHFVDIEKNEHYFVTSYDLEEASRCRKRSISLKKCKSYLK